MLGVVFGGSWGWWQVMEMQQAVRVACTVWFMASAMLVSPTLSYTSPTSPAAMLAELYCSPPCAASAGSQPCAETPVHPLSPTSLLCRYCLPTCRTGCTLMKVG